MSATQLTGRQIKSLGGDISGQGNAVSVDKIKGTPISATAPTTGQSLVFNGTSWTPTNGAGGAASALATTGADVVVSGAAPPTIGQILTATSATTAAWQSPGSNPFAGSGSFVKLNTWHMDDGAPNWSPVRSEVLAYDGTNFWMVDDNSGVLTKTDLTGALITRYPSISNVSDVIYAFSYLWVAQDGGNALFKVDPSTGAVVATYVSGQAMTYLTFNANYIFTSSSNGGNVVYRFDPTTGEFNNRFDQPETSQPDSIVTDGSTYLWIIDQSSANIRRVNRDPVYATLNVFNLVFTAIQDGSAGNAVTIKFEFKGDGLPDVNVTGSDIVITVFNQTGQAREFQIANAINNEPAATALVRISAGSPNSIHNYNQAPYNTVQNLTGGVDHTVGTVDVSASGLPIAGIYANGFPWITMDNGDLLKIDPSADTVLATFPSGATALGGCCQDGSNFIYATETAPNDKIRVFDYVNEYWVNNIAAGNNPDDVVVDYANNWVFSIDRTSALIRKLDKETGALVSTIDITGYGLPRRGSILSNSDFWVATSTGFFIKIDQTTDTITASNRTGQLLNSQAPTNLTGGADAVAATLTVQDVLYTAAVAGNAANFVTVSYTGGATAGSEVVTVSPQSVGMAVKTPVHRGNNIAFDGTDFWIAGYPDNQLLRVSTDGVVKRVHSGFNGNPREVLWDGASIWITTDSAILYKLNPATDQRAAFQVNNGTPNSMAYDGLADASDLASGVPGGNVWVATDAGFMFKFSAEGIPTTFSGMPWTQPYGMAFDGTNMWVIDHTNGFIYKVTPGGVATPYAITGNPWDIAFDGTDMWTANDDASTSKISSAGAETNYPGLQSSATGIAFDGADMWTCNPTDGSFSQVDSAGTITNHQGPTGEHFWKIAFDGANFMWSQSDNTDSLARVAVTAAGPSTAINVQIEDNVSTAQNIVDAVNGFPAAAALVTPSTGSPGNTQTVAAYAPLTAGVDAIAATYTVEGGGFYITYTAVTPGAAGNGITIEYTSGGTAGSEVVSVVSLAISIQIESGVSKYQQVTDAVNADSASNVLVLGSTNSRTATALVGITRDDGSGDLYLSEPSTKSVFRVSPSNGLQTMVQFTMGNTPDDIAFDGGGSLWSLDLTSTRIRRFDTSGIIYGGPNTAADGGLPRRMANQLPNGNLYVTMDTGHILLMDAYAENGQIIKTIDVDAANDLTGIHSNGASDFYISATGALDTIARLYYDGGFNQHITEPKDLQNPADRIKISGPWFWTLAVGDDNVRKVRASDGDTLDTISTTAIGSPLDVTSSLIFSTSNGKVFSVNSGNEQAFASLVMQDLTSTANNPGFSGNLFNIQYTGGNTLGQATVTVYDGTRLVVDIESGVTTADTVLTAILNTTGNGSFTTVLSGTGSNPQTTQAQTFFTGGGDVAPTINGVALSGKSAMGGLSEDAGWGGAAAGYTAPTDGYLRMTGLGFFYTGTTIFSGNTPQRMAADANDLWVCSDFGPDAPSRIDIATMQVVAQITGAFGNNNGAGVVALLGGYVYMGDNNFPLVYKIDPATNSVIRRINTGDATGGNQYAYVHGLFSDGSNLWVTTSVGSQFGSNIMLEKIVSDRSIASIHDIEADVSGNYQPMVKISDALYIRMNYSLHKFNTNLG